MKHSVGWTFSQNFSSIALPVWDWQRSVHIWTIGSWLNESVNESLNDGGDCRTAPATPGLLKLDGLGPVDNRLSPQLAPPHCHLTCNTWHVTCDMWHELHSDMNPPLWKIQTDTDFFLRMVSLSDDLSMYKTGSFSSLYNFFFLLKIKRAI